MCLKTLFVVKFPPTDSIVDQELLSGTGNALESLLKIHLHALADASVQAKV
jgi:hypothetical protein